jgi:hypothetical protein
LDSCSTIKCFDVYICKVLAREVIHSSLQWTYSINKLFLLRLYADFNHNPNILLPRHHHLFKRISLEDRLQQGYDDLQCWLRSVADAREVLQHHEDVLCSESALFFPIASTRSALHTSSGKSSPTTESALLTPSTASQSFVSSSAQLESASLASTVTYKTSINATPWNLLSRIDPEDSLQDASPVITTPDTLSSVITCPTPSLPTSPVAQSNSTCQNHSKHLMGLTHDQLQC